MTMHRLLIDCLRLALVDDVRSAEDLAGFLGEGAKTIERSLRELVQHGEVEWSDRGLVRFYRPAPDGPPEPGWRRDTTGLAQPPRQSSTIPHEP